MWIESNVAPKPMENTATAINKYWEVSNGNYNGEKENSEKNQVSEAVISGTKNNLSNMKSNIWIKPQERIHIWRFPKLPVTDWFVRGTLMWKIINQLIESWNWEVINVLNNDKLVKVSVRDYDGGQNIIVAQNIYNGEKGEYELVSVAFDTTD